MINLFGVFCSSIILFHNWHGYGYTNKRRSFFARERKAMYKELGISFLFVCFLGNIIALCEHTKIYDPLFAAIVSGVITASIAVSAYDSGKRKNTSP